VRFFGAAKAKWIKPILGRELQIPKIEHHQNAGEGKRQQSPAGAGGG